MKRNRYIGFVMAVLLMIGGAVESAWATKVTYHILTLPINSSRYDYQMVDGVTGYRLEALRVVVDQSSVELPNQFKSPLATNYRYYPTSAIVTGNSSRALQLFANNTKTKGYIYKVKHVDTDDSEVAPVTEGTAIEGDNAEYYVIYDYNEANTIAQLDGSVQYNIGIKNKGFLSYNRGRNNRPAVMPKGKVEAAMLTSEDFVKIENPGSGIGTYWTDAANNKNNRSEVESQFHFIFRFEGKDPYNIIIRNCYNKDLSYIEKNDDTGEFVYKWYKGGSLFGVTTNNLYIASDEHIKYNYAYNSAIANPTVLTEGDGNGWNSRPGQFHGQTKNAIWGSFALLNNTSQNGYVFMGTRTVNDNGAMPTPGSDGKYNYLKFDYNNLTINQLTPADATKNHSTEGIYPIKTIRFHVKTPFGHTLTASFNQSDYVLQSAYIDAQDIPESLHRKYCVFTGFYSDADHTHAIVKYSERTTDDIYVDYEVSSAIPFQAIAPDASYTTATWYELTDEGSTQESGRKIKYDTSAGTYKNNGGNGEYVKESEFAFVGDPYELKVLYRKGSESARANTYVTLSTYDTWEIPDDAVTGSFLLRKYNDAGYWSWNAGQLSADVAYHDDPTIDVDKDAKTITITVSGLNGGKYFGITTGGTDASQIESITPAVGSVYDETANTVTVTVKLKENTTGSAKEITVTIQEYDNDGGSTPSESPADPSVITITQGTTSTFEGNIVTYSTTERTRVKVLDLPKCDFTYKIVDKSGRIAVQATASQTIFSPLSLASIPSIIFSPFLADETVTFYKDEYVDNSGRATLTQSITETPEANDDIFVTYTTGSLSAKPIKLSEDQEFYVKLNDHYLYCETVGENVVVKTNSERVANDAYKWKLRNQDPYAMLIDNLGAREDLDVADDATERVTVYNDAGESVQEDGVTPATLDPENRPLRQVGAWVTLASIENAGALTFTTNRGLAQRFVAKRSNQGGIYEVMVATGTTVDASTTYYNIGCPGANTVKIYSNDVANGGYVHGSDVLRFVLESETEYTYHLIDKSNTILLEVGSKSPDLMFPAEYQSPLVGTYHYYDIDQFTVTNGVYTLIEGADTLTNISNLDATVSDPESSTAEAYDAADAKHKHNDATTTEEITAKAKKLETTGAHYYVIGSDYYVVNVIKAYYRDVYVTYDKNDLVTFNSNTSPYLLKFLNPLVSGYRLENGNDGLTSEEIQAVYPYCNGDGNLNIYGTEMNREQMEGGSSTRPRWVWFFESDNNDPYHVKIHSKSTISFKSINHPTYLQTYAVHFNQDANAQKQHIVTGGVLPGISSIPPSEYMVLGTEGNYRLMTTDRVPADLNGDGDTDDDGENMRQVVNAFEQYWKTYNMIKLDVLGINKNTNAYNTDESTWVVPEAQRATLKATLASYKHTATDDGDLATKVNALTATGVYFFKVGDSYKKVTVTSLATAAPATDAAYTAEDCNASDWEGLNYVDGWFWHSYDAFANATRWNGFNDKASGEEKKVVEKLEHWFQTIDMGNGAFDIVSADIPPVLVLLDRHGWEIMRKPLPKASTYPYGEELDALRIYDSPMVKEYKFYSNATKASGCHKYTLRLNDKGEERDQIKVDGEQFTSTSLAALPPRAASGVISSGAFNDQYVTYTVKDEYEESYRYHLNEETYAETGSKASKYVVLCNGRYARDKRGDFSKYHDSYFSKPIYEGSTPTGGNIYDMILSPTHTAVGDVYVDKDNNGFVDDVCLWYVTPNLNIDEEMGIKWGTATTGAEPLTQDATKLAYKDKTGFDPYNIQLKNSKDSLFFTTHMTSSKLVNGSMVGDYSGTDHYGNSGSIYITPENRFNRYEPTVDKGSEGYDHTNLQISNQTFMAVQDAKGNMQLMPRFDHTKRINFAKYDPYIMTVATPVDHDKVATIADNESMGVQTMFFVRPQANIYHIIDNDGYEALRYRAGGEWYPILPDSVRSPLAKDFRFYLTASYDGGTGKYTINESSKIEASIVGALADEQLYTSNIDIYVRYSYDEDNDEEWVLKGRWFTAQLANKDMQSSATRIVTTEGVTQGTGVSLYTGEKPGTINEDDQVWQWKFLASPMDPSSPFYEAPDPYSVKIYNRYANYSNNPSVAPNPMSIPIKVPNASDGANRFALLSHQSGGYAFAVAKTYGANPQYPYINGADMTAPSTTAAITKTEGNAIRKDANNDSDYATKKLALSDGVYYFRIHGEAGGSIPLDHRVYRFKKVTVTGGTATDEDCTRTDWENARTEGIKVVLNNDVKHNYEYNVITNGGSDYVVNHPGVLAISANQNEVEASTYDFQPHLPEEAQTMLLNMEDYLYYGSASLSDDKYTVNTNTKLISLEGLYDDTVYVRYNKYDVNTTPYKAPNIRNELNKGHVARADTSKDASINIKGELPYNIIWYNDNMMATTTAEGTTTITDGGSHRLTGSKDSVWYFTGGDPYALEIKHKASDKYAVGSADLAATATKTFMLLKKEDYDYGILQETGGTAKLTGYGNALTADANTDPTKFIIFGLSVHDLIYHLVIANTGSTVTIPYSEKDNEGNWVADFSPSDNNTKTITGTTQRDLTNNNYQLGQALSWANTSHTYCHDAGKVTVGDSLVVPSVFMRPNCVYFYYVDGIYNDAARTNVATELNNKYKGLELTRLPKDDDLVGKSVVVNVAYAFQTGLETNAGEGFVTNVADNYWYTFQTTEPTPYLAEYTKAWGLQAMEGRETRYTNDYLWSPLGDVYGFKMYNRYMYKNIGNTTNVMTKANINEAGLLEMSTHDGNDIFELLDVPNTPGAFRVHPVANYTGTQFYIYRDAADGNKVKLSTNYTGWTFGLGADLLEPYIDRKGYVGGLTTAAYTKNQAVLDKVKDGTADQADIREVQSIVYNDANIVQYSPGYYRLHSMPGIPGMATVRYASGYLHDTEKTAGYGSAGIPMHFYSRKGVATTFAGTDGLASGFTVSNATRGEIPIDSTEVDPSTIFHFAGAAAVSGYPSSTISTQGLYVVANANGDANNGTTDSKLQRAAMAASGGISFTIMDIGGAVLLIHDGADAEKRKYFNYDQEANIYDLKFFHNANTEEARWCMQPVQKTAAAGDGEMPLLVTTHNGGDGYYYTTFYAPFDVLLPADADGKTYYAYYCDKWNDNNLHPKKVPAVTGTPSYAAGKYVPAGTPVIIRVNDESGHVTLTLPSTNPSASPVAGNIFLGQYLEQLLTADAAHDVYTLGLPFTSEVTGFDRTTGEVTAPLPEQATSGLGFYINATPNKESAQLQSLWQRNNRYVLHNKIYYRATGGSSPAPGRDPQFVPVLFGDDDEQPTQPDDNQQPTVGDGNVYDLLGRKVATEAEVRDGTWHLRLTPGIYIVGGKKVCVGIY